ncbi:MAG TPA: hypothetical protein VJ757_05350 [Pseudonocardiaceae bacterium]|nr:hypothetical protein [Pseudonocardiaceae bacterium]
MEKTIGIYFWKNMTMLDVLGPQQFLGFVPGFKVVTFASTTDPVVSDTGVRLIPDCDFSTCPPLDILLVGGGVNPLPEMRDPCTRGPSKAAWLWSFPPRDEFYGQRRLLESDPYGYLVDLSNPTAAVQDLGGTR